MAAVVRTPLVLDPTFGLPRELKPTETIGGSGVPVAYAQNTSPISTGAVLFVSYLTVTQSLLAGDYKIGFSSVWTGDNNSLVFELRQDTTVLVSLVEWMQNQVIEQSGFVFITVPSTTTYTFEIRFHANIAGSPVTLSSAALEIVKVS